MRSQSFTRLGHPRTTLKITTYRWQFGQSFGVVWKFPNILSAQLCPLRGTSILKSVQQRTRLGTAPVRVNRREHDTTGDNATYVLPDARVTDVTFDWTLTRKTAGRQQVRGFFNSDFKPSSVVIIRPSQLGTVHTYVIARPEAKR